MGSKIPPTKALQDIEDCVSELKKESLNGSKVINDDSATLHRFQEKLESILLFGLLEKPGLLGPKKSYWNYICACFASSKRSHDGITYVKSVVQLKTPLGHGRAFIRFCLSQKCLADTLQSCFMDQKITKDFYIERSLATQEKLWSTLVTSLYDLNELNFDLSAGHPELDISWPKFARKHFTSLATENFPYKNMSAPNLQSFSLQAECNATKYTDSGSLSAFDACTSSSSTAMGNLDAVKISDSNEELSKQNKRLEEEIENLKKERLRLQQNIQNLQTEYQFFQQNVKCTCTDECHKAKVKLEDKDVQTSFISEKKSESSFEKGNEKTHMDVVDISNPGSLSLSEKPSVKSKIINETTDNSVCALQQSNSDDMDAVTFSGSSVLHRTSDNLCITRSLYLPQNHVYISEHLLEIKTAIDDIEDIVQKSDVNLAVPHISRLKKIRNSLEEKLHNEFDRSKSYANFSQFVENCVASLKKFVSKQENIINSLQEKVNLSVNQNQNLYTRISVLKDLLVSYGFLKISYEKEFGTKSILPLDIGSVASESHDEFFCDNLAHDPLLKRIIVPLLPVLNSTITKLSKLNEKVAELQFGIESSQELNNNLISRVQDQEMHLKGVTKELEEAQHLVSVLKKQHRKLQSAEGILKYDLQEKRKLLTRLRQQLENTREDFNLVRIKNSKSEAEWQDLRKEFVQRHKQTSEESGFIDDKTFEEHEAAFSSSNCDSNLSEGSSENVSESNNSESNVEEAYHDITPKKSRLELLEEQCQSLYSSLLESSKRRQDIDRRLETMCKTIEKSHTGIVHSGAFSADVPSENVSQNTNDTSVHSSSEDICQNVIFSSDSFVNSPPSSSDVGSLNSECSSYIPGICNETNSSDSYYCESSKTNSCISFSPCKLQASSLQTSCVNEHVHDTSSLLDSDSVSVCISECKVADEVIVSSCDSGELGGTTLQNAGLEEVSLSHVDSLLIKKKDLEESIKSLGIDNGLSSDKNGCLDSEEFAKQISALQEEKRLLLNKIQELERNTLIKSTELDQTAQQLILSKAAKEHEVAALQFQLNTEALKYERAFKEFSEQSKGLESMKQKVTEQEYLILTLEQALTEIRMDRENEKEHQWQESISDVEKEKNKNEILQSQLEELKAYNQKDRETMEAELIHLQSDSRELQKKLIKLLKEKDILWKKSNHLYHLQKAKTDYRWMNDSEVSNCMGCRITFSFMLRKHHCRLCGRIFCYSCSNNWLLTASSRKKIRSCNECFMQYMEMKKDLKKGGDVPQIDDDSEDDSHNGELPFIPMSSSSFSSDVPSSITDSIISLPIMQKQSTHLFASAPDLRYVMKPEEGSSNLKPNKDIFKENDEKDVNNDQKNIQLDTDISSDDCTSVTLEEESSNIIRLKDVSVDEIRTSEYGLNGEFVIHSGEKADLPIVCQICPIILKWSFTSSCQNIPITIMYAETSASKTTVIYQDKHKMEDEMKISYPGYYMFHFDNLFRVSDTKIQYVLLTKSASQTEDSVHEKLFLRA